MTVSIKTFQETTKEELYQLLQLRSEVFVVEQDCVYQDLDGKDDKAIHVLGLKQNNLVAYTRIFNPGDYFETASIGRVVVRLSERSHNYGKAIMQASIDYIEAKFDKPTITLSAQTYLVRFYNSLGFVETGNQYLEDGIPHIKMVRIKS